MIIFFQWFSVFASSSKSGLRLGCEQKPDFPSFSFIVFFVPILRRSLLPSFLSLLTSLPIFPNAGHHSFLVFFTFATRCSKVLVHKSLGQTMKRVASQSSQKVSIFSMTDLRLSWLSILLYRVASCLAASRPAKRKSGLVTNFH